MSKRSKGWGQSREQKRKEREDGVHPDMTVNQNITADGGGEQAR